MNEKKHGMEVTWKCRLKLNNGWFSSTKFTMLYINYFFYIKFSLITSWNNKLRNNKLLKSILNSRNFKLNLFCLN